MLRCVDIDAAWPLIASAAAKLLPEGHTAIRDACLRGDAVCLECDDGVLVVCINVNPDTHAREFHVRWANVFAGGCGEIGPYLAAVAKMARDLKCKAITFDSSRMAWFKTAPRSGFTLRNAQWVLPLESVQ